MVIYDSSSIRVFKGLDAVRKRPGMYIGNIDDGSGLHKMIFEVVDNSIDEYLAGECTLVKVILRSDGYVTISDNGRGMPVDYHKEEGISAAEVIMTILHSGAKFDDKFYAISGGLHGVGISVVNALSSNLILKIFRSGFIYKQEYCFGKPVSKLDIIGNTNDRGTEISFLPDSKIFSFVHFDYQVLFDRFTELSFLNSGIKLVLIDQRVQQIKEDVFYSVGGLKSFLNYINKSNKVINKDIICFSGVKDSINVNVAIQWIEECSENLLCYTNNIFQKDGGSHLIAFKFALTKFFRSYIEDSFLKKSEFIISGEDIREGMVAILSIYMKDPKFSSQIKDKLVSAEARQAVEHVILSNLKKAVCDNPNMLKLIANRIILSAKSRYAAKKARETIRKKNSMDNISLCGKLSECQEKNPLLSELFLVEGDSAGGSAKQARDRHVQAVLPLKGKILNVERSSFDKILSSFELKSVVGALKCGVGVDDYDEKKLRYHKVIFMTDADIDGAHIRTLLLTFFYRHIPMLIENNHVFISNPPLYRFYNNTESFYIRDKNEFNDFLFSRIFSFLKSIPFPNLDSFYDVLCLYKDLLIIFDKLDKVCPKSFFIKMIYYSNSFCDFYGKFSIDNFSSYLSFFNKLSDCDQIVSLDSNFFNDNFIKILFLKYGVSKSYLLKISFFESLEYQLIFNFSKNLREFFFNNFIFIDKKKYSLLDFEDLIATFSNKILSNYNIQRYKGLGEMNSQQLWDTTMNPKTRDLRLVKIKDALSANSIFSDLMGENIEARKSFIYKNIDSLTNLDF
jgi:DNA gyrase subunit B